MRIIIKITLIVTFLCILLSTIVSDSPMNISSMKKAPQETVPISNLDEMTPWWDTNFYYRRLINLTDVYSTPRVDVPIDVYLPFENNTCYKNSIRVIDSSGIEIPSQPHNFTYWEDTDYIKGATIFWYAEINADNTTTYWVYYSGDKSIEPTNYDSVVSFARTTGTLSGKFGPNYWSFSGDWYNVTMYNAAGGKITNGAHKMDDGSWNWNWGTNQGSMHWNPDGLAGQGTSNTAPIAGTTFVNEDGPLFINYTTQLPFGSYARLNVTYTFYKWGWITRIYIKYSATVSGSGRTDEWVFYPYLTIEAIKVDSDLTQTYYSNWAQSGNMGQPAGFGWWNDNGISHGTVRISHDSWNTNPSYPNNYNDYYYRWWDQGSYEFWDTSVPTIYAISGTVLEETCAFAVWNGADGLDGYMRVFNATSRYLPIIINIGEVSSYSLSITVKDLGDTTIENVNVTLLDSDTGQILYMNTGEPYSKLSDQGGHVTFIGLQNKTYTIAAWIDSRDWLNEQSGSTGMNVTFSDDFAVTGPFTPVFITLDISSINIHLEDLMGDNLGTIESETIQVRIYNASDADSANWKYMDYRLADASGNLIFSRIPKCDWVFKFSYSDTDTGHIYQWKDFSEYGLYEVTEDEIASDLTRNWKLPLITLDFNVKAYDGVVVPNAYIQISKKGTGDPYPLDETDSRYNITHYTDTSGSVAFYRVLNGTWNIYLYRSDNYGQTAFNNTEQLVNIQNYQFTQMKLPLTWLRVLVEDEDTNRVTGAQLDLKVNGILVVTTYTNSSGLYDFHWIKANDTSIPWTYTITATKAGQAVTRTVYASFNSYYTNKLTLTAPAYSKVYTELNCTQQFYSWKYGDNRTFIIGWYNRTSLSGTTYEDTALSNYLAGTLTFTIWHKGVQIGEGSWNSSSSIFIWYEASSGIHFTIIIDTLYWSMGASAEPYFVKIIGSAPGYATTEIYSVTIVMSPATTTTTGPTSDNQYWSDGFAATYSLHTTPYGRAAFNLTGLTYANYTIYNSLNEIIAQASLTDLGDGHYRFSDLTLNSSYVGVYRVMIWLYKGNYVNQTVTLTVTYNTIPTSLTWLIQPSTYTWGSGSPSATLYFLDTIHGTPIAIPDSVTFYWINQQTGASILIDTSSSLNYNYPNDIVGVGTWKIRAHVSKANYFSDIELSASFTINAAPTQIIITSSDTDTVQWGSEYAEFDFIYRLVSPTVNIPGATLWNTTWTGETLLVDNGDGTYRLRMLSIQEAANYTVTFSMWIANRTVASGIIYMNVLIPLDVTTEDGASQQTPVQQYFTRLFRLSVVAGDLSNQSTFVSGVTISYVFNAGSLSGVMYENTTGKYYWIEFLGSVVAEPGIYEIQVYASRQGCTSTQTSIWIEVLATPSRVFTDNQLLGGEEPPLYYGDTQFLNFTWIAEIDEGIGIGNPDFVQISLWRGRTLLITNMGGVIDLGEGVYQFHMDTKLLGMSAYSSTAPTLYQIEISFRKFGFENPPTVTIIVLVSQTPTEAIADPVSTVIWSEDLYIRVNLMDIIHDVPIWTSAIVELQYGSQVVSFVSLNNGTFILIHDSSDIFGASEIPYSVTIQYRLPNYIDGSISVSIQVAPIEGEIFMVTSDLRDHTYEGSWTDNVAILFQARYLEDNSTNLPMCYATYYWVGYSSISGTINYDSFFYDCTIDTSLVPAGIRTLRILLVLGNHTITPFDIVMNIQPLVVDFVPDTLFTTAIHGSSAASDIVFSISYEGIPLLGAEVSVIWNGVTFRHTMIGGNYVVSVRPSQVLGLTAPATYILNFTMALQNYTASVVQIELSLLAPTTIVIDSDIPITVEYGQNIVIIFAYQNTLTGSYITASTINAIIQTDSGELTITVVQYNSTHYYIEFNSADVGVVRVAPYIIAFIAFTDGYQEWTTDNPFEIDLVITEPTYNFGILGRYPQTTVNTIALMSILFAVVAGSVVAVRRMRIPYQIKQIDKAVKQIEKGKVAKVEKIKTMGTVVSELLASGLSELDIEAPVIESSPEDSYEDYLGDDTEDLLGELDALDEVVIDNESIQKKDDFEASLEAELEAISEEEKDKTPDETHEESKGGVKVSKVEESIESEGEATLQEGEIDQSTESELEFELEELEEESEETHDEVFEAVEAPEKDLVEEYLIEEEKAEVKARHDEVEDTEGKEPESSLDEEVDLEDLEDDSSEVKESIEDDLDKLSKAELIELLPDELKKKYSDAELQKLSTEELRELLDYVKELDGE